MVTNEQENNSCLKDDCFCCGSSLEKESQKGPYDMGAYRIVCRNCWQKSFLHFPDKKIGRDGLSYPPKKGDSLNLEPNVWKGPTKEGKRSILLVEPDYYSRFPPLGLLKLSAFHKAAGDQVELVRFPKKPKGKPDTIYVTSLFTYSWKKVHEAVRYYQKLFPEIEIVLGGVYASLLPDHAMASGADYICVGLILDVEGIKPDYSVPINSGWDSNIVFSSRGCIRRCGFCAVPRLEKEISFRDSIIDLIDHKLKKVILWDNNILSTPNWRKIFDELEELRYEVDFNQGFDARLVTQENAERIARLKTKTIRLAYDSSRNKKYVHRAITLLSEAGIRKRKILVYTLFNYTDTPTDFLQRVKDLLKWGVVSYPMRYEPLSVLVKNKFVSPNWTSSQLNLVQRARRVIGYAGAFPPYKPLIEKLDTSEKLELAIELRPSIEEIRRNFKGIESDKAKLLYAYYKKYNLTRRELPLKMALIRAEMEKDELLSTMTKLDRRRLKRLNGNSDWRLVQH